MDSRDNVSPAVPSDGAQSTQAPLPTPRMRMVPAGSHFSKPASDSGAEEESSSVARPAGARFAAKGPQPQTPAAEVRRRGTRFAPTPLTGTESSAPAPEARADSAAAPALDTAAPRPAGTRFRPAPTSASSENPSPEGRPAGTRFARPAADAPATTSAPAGTRFASVPSPDQEPAAPAAAPAEPAAATAQIPVSRVKGNDVPQIPFASTTNAAATGSAPASAANDGAAPNNKSRRKGKILSTILIVLGIILLLVAGGLFIATQLRYQEAQSTYTELEQYTVTSDEGEGIPDVDFAALQAVNPDVIGWIYIPGTPINYPVVQTDDNTTYLHTLADGTRNASGAIFMDMDDTAPGMIDQQTTLYGHHTYDGAMFQTIDWARDQAEFDKIGKVYYITPDTTYTLTPLFVSRIEDTYVDARTPNFTEAGTSLTSYLQDLYTMAQATAPDAEERIASADRVLSLVTCAGEIIPRTTRAVMVLSVDQIVAHGV